MTALTILLVSILTAVSAGVAATTYVNILTQPGQVLAFWARWLYSLKDNYVESGRPMNASDEAGFDRIRKRGDRAEYMLKPLLTCVYCVGGQMGFWLSVYVFWSYDSTFCLIPSLLTAVMSVYLGGLFQYIQQKYFPL